ncbi:MAG: choice-of-anchor J domain-containing protein, partial [Muribaculaceae bacterium]|nr:choice-of-anchor J domain-containing protein [Muribaculaceae bacterium]
AWSLPYVEPFNPGCWSAYTVIDANGDGGAWDWEDPVWKYDDVYYCAFFYHFYLAGPSDDWLITPKIAFEEGKLYRMTFQAYGYYTTTTNDFEVAFGNAPTVDGMHTVLGHQTLNGTTINDRAQISYIFAPRAGDQFVGFHNITEVPNHLSIDNLLIEEIGVSSVPAAVNNLKATLVDRSGIVDLSFDAPILDAAGKALKGNMDIALYRADAATPFKTLKDVKPGEHVAFTDNEAYPALNIYRVVTSNADGEGLSESVSIDLRAGTPQPVTQVKASLVNSNQVSLTWEASTASTDENGNEIDTKNIRYNVYRPSIYGDLDVIGRSISDCFFLDNDPTFMSGDNQATMVYYVTAVNGDGESAQTASNVVTIGDTYKLPFAETWANGANATSPWLQSNATAGWTITSQGYNPMTPGQDGFGLLSMELGVGGEEYDLLDQSTGIMWSPRVDLSNVKDATLTFYLFGQNTYHANDCMTIYLDIEGVGQKELGKFQPRTFAGWRKCELDLTPYVGYDRVSVVLYGVLNRKATDTEAPRMHIDNFSITGTPVEKEVKISAIKGPGEIRSEVPSVYKVSVTNLGISDAQNVPVSLYADNEQVAKQTVDIIKAGETKVIEFEYTPAGASDDLVEVLAEITYNEAYDNVNNNNTMTMLVKVLPINLPYVTDLNGIYYQDNQEAVLSWSYPSVADEFETVIDGAEAYDAFAINDFGCWTVNDVDGVLPFKFSDPTTEKPLAWDNNDQPQAWMVFNPSNVTSDRTFYPYTGAQVFTSFAAATPNGNDDWLISPELSGEAQLISFVVRRLNERDSSEKYNVLYSTTDTNPESFRRLNGANPLYAPFEWEVKNFALPEDAKYFAIKYVGVMQSAMMVDDLQFEGYPTHVRPDGYRIYRDGKLLNSSLTSRTSFTDSNVADGVYT